MALTDEVDKKGIEKRIRLHQVAIYYISILNFCSCYIFVVVSDGASNLIYLNFLLFLVFTCLRCSNSMCVCLICEDYERGCDFSRRELC